MSALVIDGRALSHVIRGDVERRAQALHAKGVKPKCVAIVSEGDAPGLLYAQTAKRGGAEVGVEIEIAPIGAGADTSGAIAIVARVVEEPTAHAVILQRPLPKRIEEINVVAAMDPRKDVDCCHPLNVGLLALGAPTHAPATASAIVELLQFAGNRPIEGARAVVLGRSAIVGRPAAMLLTAANATVTICHSRTLDLREICSQADIIVAAVGRPHFLTADMVHPGATIIDVGTNVVNGRLTGDVDPLVKEKVAAITPVPGGVGPVTTAVLLRNIVAAAERVVFGTH